VVKDNEGRIYNTPHDKFYTETVLKYKTKDGYTGYIVKVRTKKEKQD
jgi:hypothetical protein|tara:strand:+ start:49 stop:189 length:141 start_codon:yes stop_codon:yes gene_type:complete